MHQAIEPLTHTALKWIGLEFKLRESIRLHQRQALPTDFVTMD